MRSVKRWRRRAGVLRRAMAPDPRYRWLQVAGIATLLLAVLMLVLAVQRTEEERRKRDDIGARAAEIMNQIEAEAARIEREAAKE